MISKVNNGITTLAIPFALPLALSLQSNVYRYPRKSKSTALFEVINEYIYNIYLRCLILSTTTTFRVFVYLIRGSVLNIYRFFWIIKIMLAFFFNFVQLSVLCRGIRLSISLVRIVVWWIDCCNNQDLICIKALSVVCLIEGINRPFIWTMIDGQINSLVKYLDTQLNRMTINISIKLLKKKFYIILFFILQIYIICRVINDFDK